MTLRQLWVMFRAKSEYEGFLSAWHGALVVRAFSGAKLDPKRLNPFGRTKGDSEKLREAKALIARVSLGVLVHEAFAAKGIPTETM